MAYTGFHDLRVWHLGVELADETYRLTEKFPKHELYALANQMQRAGVSVPSNIAEGHQRQSTREYLYHISIALGSLAELETQFIISLRRQYVAQADYDPQCERIHTLGRGLRALQKSLRTKLAKSRPTSPLPQPPITNP